MPNTRLQQPTVRQTTRKQSSSSTGTSSSIGWKTKFREGIIPFLPPPVTNAIHEFDNFYYTQIGPEASITVGSALFIAWIVWVIILITGRHLLFGTGRALVDDDDDDGNNNTNSINTNTSDKQQQQKHPCKATVLLCGPIYGGKTRIFYHLCNGPKFTNIPTLSSIKVNVGTGLDRVLQIQQQEQQVDGSGSTSLFKKEYIQYVDWPGRATLDDPNFVRLVTEEASVSLRVIFVLDSTRPISSAAQVLFELLDLVNKRKQRELITIVIACNKKDLIKSKNARRIKIQMRSELEKILTVHFKTAEAERNSAIKENSDPIGNKVQQKGMSTSTTASSSSLWWPQGKPIDLDNLQFCKLRFLSTTCCTTDDKGMNAILQYCSNGTIP